MDDEKIRLLPKRADKVDTVVPEVVSILEEWLAAAKKGELHSVGLVGRVGSGDWQTGFSSSPNRLEDAGMLIELAMRRLGFARSS